MSRKITTDIFITEAKEVHGNLYDYSKVDYKTSVEKVIIICKKHGEFKQAPANHKKGMGCRKCAAERFTSTTDKFIKKAMNFHGDKYDYSKVNYKKSHLKVEIICPKHGSFFQTPNKHLQGGCQKCGYESTHHIQTFTTKDFIKNALKVHGDLYDYSKVDYKTARKKVIIICNKHGEFEQTPDSHVNSSQGCPYCVGKAVGPSNSTEYLYPKVAAEWHPTKNNILPSEISPGSSKKIWFICPKGHEYKTNLSHRTSEYKKKTGCPYCAGQKVSSDNNLQARFPAIAKEWHTTKNELKPFEVMPGTDKKYWWLCPKGHEYKATPDKRTTKDKRTGEGTSCPYCTSQTSTQEMRIMAELDYLGIKILSRYKFKNTEFDIFLPEFSIGIEYDGSYWHKDRADKDRLKNNFAIKNNINLIRIREFPLQKINQDDISTKNNAYISKKEINLLMDAIQKYSSDLNNKIKTYKKLKDFVNEELFNKYKDYSPSPLPEKSLEFLHPEVSKEWHYEKNFPLTPKNFTRGSSYKAWWKCNKGHEWKTSISHRTGKKPTGCYKCYLEKRKSNNQENTRSFVKKAKNVHGNKFDYSEVEYVNSKTKVTIICSKHGEFNQVPSSHLMGAGCKKCATQVPNNKLNTRKFINRSMKIFGNKFDYSKTVYKGIKSNITLICSEHGEFVTNADNHLASNISGGCRKCKYKKISMSLSLTSEEFITKAYKVWGNEYDYSEVNYVNANKKVSITCSKHGNFHQTPGSHLSGNGCPKCYFKTEGRIAEYLKKKSIVHREYRIKDKRYDFYLPKYNLIIERDGEQHYRDSSNFSSYIKKDSKLYLQEQVDNDSLKTKLALDEGFKIARIPYWLTKKEEEIEIENILAGKPTYPDVPDLEQEKTKPRPVKNY